MIINLIKDLRQYDGVLIPLCEELTRRGHQVQWSQTTPPPTTRADARVAIQDVAYRVPHDGVPRFFINHGSSCIKSWGLGGKWDLNYFIAPTEYWATEAARQREDRGLDFEISPPVGWPKVDDILKHEHDYQRRAGIRKRLQLVDEDPVVCYYPTYKKKSTRHSWERKYDVQRAVRQLMTHTRNVVVVPHQMDDTSDFDDLPVKVYRGNDRGARVLFTMSDIVVSDTSGAAFECCALDKPVILMVNDEVPHVYGTGEMVDFGPHATDETVGQVLEVFLRDRGWYTRQRRRWRDYILGPCDGTASRRVVDYMESVLLGNPKEES